MSEECTEMKKTILKRKSEKGIVLVIVIIIIAILMILVTDLIYFTQIDTEISAVGYCTAAREG